MHNPYPNIGQMEMEEFFGIFIYANMMHDAICGGLTYEGCEILRDIQTPSGSLRKGDRFETVYLMLSEGTFEFCNWKQDPDGPRGNMISNETSVFIPQKELAPYCHWEYYQAGEGMDTDDYESCDKVYWSKHPSRKP